MLRAMSKKSAKIAALIDQCHGQELNAHYVGYFVCFNRGLFYEAHEVLEELWLADRHGPNGLFYKGLIQLAGAFVHLQKGRLRPADALFELARANLERYRPLHDRLDVKSVLELISDWRSKLQEGAFSVNPLTLQGRPNIMLS